MKGNTRSELNFTTILTENLLLTGHIRSKPDLLNELCSGTDNDPALQINIL